MIVPTRFLVLAAISGMTLACSSDPSTTAGASTGGRSARAGSGAAPSPAGSSAAGSAPTGIGGTGNATTTGDAGTGNGGTSSGGVAAGGVAAGGVAAGGVAAGGVAGAAVRTAGTAAGGKAGKGGAAAGSGGSAGGNTVNAAAMVADMGFGANIGNTLENTTSWETGWGQPLITQTFINGMASRGIKTVRVPVAWNTYATNGVIDATKMNRVKEVVGWIEAAGMYSIVNIHWDGGWIYNESNASLKYTLTSDVKTKFASYWKQIGTAFSGVGHKLIFEGLNEEGNFYPNGDNTKTPDYAALNELNQLFVTTVRAQGGYNASRAMLIAGFVTDIDLTCVDAFTVPTDPAGAGKLFLSIHYYTPYTFTGLDKVETWGSPATTWGTAAEKAQLQSLFTKLATFSTNKKTPVIIGEFGAGPGTNYPRESASRILWMETVAKTAMSNAMVPVLWDTGSEIKRADGSLSTELQSVMTYLNQ